MSAEHRRGPEVRAGAGERRGPEAATTGARWRVYTHGGSKETAHEAVAWCKKLADLGAGEILLTSMDRDGTTEGYDLELTRRVVHAVDVPVIASGGAGTLEHLRQALVDGGADAALAASIFHDRTHSVREAKQHLAKAGVAMRMS